MATSKPKPKSPAKARPVWFVEVRQLRSNGAWHLTSIYGFTKREATIEAESLRADFKDFEEYRVMKYLPVE